MKYLHAIAGLLAIAAVYVIAVRPAFITKEGLENGTQGTVSEQLKAATKGLDGATELMAGMSGMEKDKDDVKLTLTAYKAFLQNSLAAGVITLAEKTSKNMNAVVSPSSDVQSTLNEMAIMKKQLDYVSIAEQLFNDSAPMTSKSAW